jgi:hypothetical protein
MNVGEPQKITRRPIKENQTLASVRRLIAIFESQYVDTCEDGKITTSWARSAIEQTIKEEANCGPELQSKIEAILYVIADLLSIGWKVHLSDTDIFVAKPEDESVDDIRRRIITARDRQLSKPSVQRFVRSMEGWQTYRGRQVSIFSLIQDGRDLIDRLERQPRPSEAPIRPYVQLVRPGEKCQFTGLSLNDICATFG